MNSARDAVNKKDFFDQCHELDEKEFWRDVDDLNARVDACVVPECLQNTDTAEFQRRYEILREGFTEDDLCELRQQLEEDEERDKRFFARLQQAKNRCQVISLTARSSGSHTSALR